MYKEELRQGIINLIISFHGEEKRNRVTSFNIGGLLGVINALFDENKIKDEEGVK